jgi:FAD:protein FMN transferase
MSALAVSPQPTATNENALLGDRFEQHRSFVAMGGSVHLRVAHHPGGADEARRELGRVERRINAWASRLTRFDSRSDLCALNAAPAVGRRRVGPTLGAVLERSVGLGVRTGGLLDVSMLDARLAAEDDSAYVTQRGTWSIWGRGRGRYVERHAELRFDLDGVAKGWIADRALALLDRYPAAMVDADGDIALRVAPSSDWQVAIEDPFMPGEDVGVIAVPESLHGQRLGVATSGTSVHRWAGPSGQRHHIIDPRTGRPAITDVVQASVIAETADAAEALAKTAVISGSSDALRSCEAAGAQALLMLLDDGQFVVSERAVEWLS